MRHGHCRKQWFEFAGGSGIKDEEAMDRKRMRISKLHQRLGLMKEEGEPAPTSLSVALFRANPPPGGFSTPH